MLLKPLLKNQSCEYKSGNQELYEKLKQTFNI